MRATEILQEIKSILQSIKVRGQSTVVNRSPSIATDKMGSRGQSLDDKINESKTEESSIKMPGSLWANYCQPAGSEKEEFLTSMNRKVLPKLNLTDETR